MNNYKPKKMIQYSEPWIDDMDIDAITGCLKNGYDSSMPHLRIFENNFAEYIGTKYAIAFSSGTAALHACTFAIGLKEGDEAITSPITFNATTNSVLYLGARPIFADIDCNTYNISSQSIEHCITSKTRALIPVHFSGQPCDLEKIMEIAQRNNLYVIEDACHAIGATYKQKMVGSFGDLAVFSFHPVKNIVTGEGGMVTTNNDELAKKVALFRTHGISRVDKPAFNILLENEPWRGDQEILGYNYRMTDFQGALGISQLKKLPRFLERRRNIAEKYNNSFKDLPGITIPFQLKDTNSAWHLYILSFDKKILKKSRAQLFKELREKNVGVWVHYVPVYYHSYYQTLGYVKGISPNAEKLYETILSIPLFPFMTDEMVEYIIRQIKDTIT